MVHLYLLDPERTPKHFEALQKHVTALVKRARPVTELIS